MNAKAIPVAKFRLGRIVTTPHVLEVIPNEDILAGISRHQAGDWGDVDNHDREANDQSLQDRTRLFSIYHSAKQIKFWIITEADRSLTTVLLPQDY